MLQITDLAIDGFKSILKENEAEAAGIRVFMSTGGCCGGGSVALEIMDNPEQGDNEVDFNGLRVFIDPQVVEMTENASIDYFPNDPNPGFRLLGVEHNHGHQHGHHHHHHGSCGDGGGSCCG